MVGICVPYNSFIIHAVKMAAPNNDSISMSELKKFTFSDQDGEYSVDEKGFVEITLPNGEEHMTLLCILWRSHLQYCKEHEAEFTTIDLKPHTSS